MFLEEKVNKRHIPVLITIVLIIILSSIIGVGWYMEKYSYSDERADLNEYFGVTDEKYPAIIYNDDIREEKALYYSERVYLPFDFVVNNINDHFYYDERENLLLFTTANDLYTATVGGDTYTVGDTFMTSDGIISIKDGETLYIQADYVKLLANYEYAYHPAPGRVTVKTSWEPYLGAAAKKDVSVRILGGIKSPILSDITTGTTLKILEEMEEWDKVETEDGFIGYLEKKHMTTPADIAPTPVTEVPEVVYTVNHMDKKVCLVWNMVTNMTANGSAVNLLANTKGVNVISPTWFSLSDNSGNFSSLASTDYVSAMHERGIEVWALLDNFSGEVTTSEVVNVTSNRQNLIRNIINICAEYDLDGINVDFESVTDDAAEGYIQFLRELSIACRKSGIRLSADISSIENFNKAELGEVVDYVILMGYDEHVSASDGAGSVASIGFVRDFIDRTCEVVDESKVVNGLPFYTRLWSLNGNDISSTAYSMSEMKNYLTEHNVSYDWNSETAQNFADFTEDGVEYLVWIEDVDSINAKLQVMSDHSLAGVAGWRLGQEDPAIWDAISAYTMQP